MTQINGKPVKTGFSTEYCSLSSGVLPFSEGTRVTSLVSAMRMESLNAVGGGQKLDHSGGQFSSTFWVTNQTITEKRPRYLRSFSPGKTSQLWPPYWYNRSPPPT